MIAVGCRWLPRTVMAGSLQGCVNIHVVLVPHWELNAAHAMVISGRRKGGNMRRLCTCAGLAIALLGGCSTTAVDRAQRLSEAGVAYSQATSAIVDQGIDASIDASSERQLRIRPRQPVTAPAAQAERAANLKTLDDELVGNVINYTRLKQSVAAVEAYFSALGALAGASPGDATEKAVGRLADRVNGLNAALDRGKGGAPLLSDAQKTAIASLSGAVAKEIHGAAVARALERDAPVIGRALVLQQMALQAATDDIRANLEQSALLFYKDRVEGPYKQGTFERGWIDDHRVAVRTRAVGSDPEAIATANAAAARVEEVWRRILSGEYSPEELTAILKDTEALLAAVNALRAANAEKAQK